MKRVRSIPFSSSLLAPILFAAAILSAMPAEAATGTVKGTPQLISFGAVTTGQVANYRQVTWTNGTETTINIFNWVVSSNPPFDFHDFDQSTCAQVGATLFAGQSCSFDVAFAPTSAGKYDGTIVFSYYINDPGDPQFVTVTLKGTGK
jgi:hypothetical protein